MSHAVVTLFKALVDIVNVIEVVASRSDVDCFLADPGLIDRKCAGDKVVNGKHDAPGHHRPKV